MTAGRHGNRVRQAPASIVYLANEYELADFDVPGMGFADKLPERKPCRIPRWV